MKLDDIEKNKDLFAAPEGYFDTLPMRVQARARSAGQQSPWATAWANLKLGYLLPALGLALVLYAFWPDTAGNPLDLSQISTAQIEEYLLQDPQIDDAEVVDYLLKSGRTLGLEDAGVEVPGEWLEDEVEAADLEEYL
jgi:hypothetical protein